MISNNQKGVSIYIALILTSIILAVGLGMSLLLIGQLKMTQEIGDSTKAFFAADAGIEMVLGENIDDIIANSNGDYSFVSLDGTADYGYKVRVYSSPACLICGTIPSDIACTGLYLCYKSKGIYKNITRAIEIKR
jgi:hypothetical protein